MQQAQYSNPSSTRMKSLPLPAGENKLTLLSCWRVARLLIKVVYKEVSSICDPTRAHGHQTQFKLVAPHRYLNWIFVCCWFIWTVGYQKWHDCLTSSSRSAAMLRSRMPWSSCHCLKALSGLCKLQSQAQSPHTPTIFVVPRHDLRFLAPDLSS